MIQSALIVEDDDVQRQMLATLLYKRLNLKSHEAGDGQKALEILDHDQGKTIKLVILDLNMPVMNGMEALKIIRQKHHMTPVVILTGRKDTENAVQAMKLGAADFLVKPYESERMVVTAHNALKISTLSKEVLRLKNEKEGTFTFENLIGHNDGLAPVVNIGRKAAAADIPVLITGETGTGKEIFARAIHGESARSSNAFIAVNCGAIPSQLAESTLFGHKKGAFTGATDTAIGKFREADGGTIFLDEVGELPLDTQVKLLRALQQKEVEPVGAGKTVPVNVRIISATNRNLQKAVESERFREDLFFRLNVLQIELPPLRERKQDIPALISHFIERFCFHAGKTPGSIAKDTEKQLIEFDWPGNIRQLENAIHRAVVISEDEFINLNIQNLTAQTSPPTSKHKNQDASNNRHLHRNIRVLSDNGHFKTIYEIEQEAMQLALDYFNHNITQAAKALGIAKSTFYKKMKQITRD